MKIFAVPADGHALRPGVIDLGGHEEFTVPTMLSPQGNAPGQPNGMDEDRYGTEYLRARTRQLVALFDNPLYSFMQGAEAATREKMRTTTAVGDDAVSELYAPSHGGVARGRFYAPMPGTLREEQRKKAPGRVLPGEAIKGRSASGHKRVASVTGDGAYPVVGKIGADGGDDDDDDFFAPDTAPALTSAERTRAAETLSAVHESPSLVAARNMGNGSLSRTILLQDTDVLDSTDPLVANSRVRALPADVEANPLLPNAQARPVTDDPEAAAQGLVDVPVVDPSANVEFEAGRYAYDLENGESSLLRRLHAGQQLSPSDMDAWRLMYTNGEGITRPVPRTTPDEVAGVRKDQRNQIERFAKSAPPDLEWRVLPENLRVLFLTPIARLALEHAAWMAQFQQPFDVNRPPPMQVPNSAFSHDRQCVPVIDLITHKQVRTPFQTLFILIILYWKHRRLADTKQSHEDLVQMNQTIMTLRTMREETNGFVSLMGHYDVAAQRSRFDLAEARALEAARTGRFHSDMDRAFYSQSQAPGSTVSRLMSVQPSAGVSLSQDAAVANAIRAAGPHATHSEVARDARARHAMVMSIFSAGRP